MKVLIADAGSSILLTKAQVLAALTEEAEVLIPASVEREVCGSVNMKKHPDASIISSYIRKGKIQATKVKLSRSLPVSLGRGERDAILLFFQENTNLLLTDDGRTVKTCRLLEIPFTTSPRVVIDLYRAGRLTREKARRALEKLSVIGRYSADVVAAAFERLAATSKGET